VGSGLARRFPFPPPFPALYSPLKPLSPLSFSPPPAACSASNAASSSVRACWTAVVATTFCSASGVTFPFLAAPVFPFAIFPDTSLGGTSSSLFGGSSSCQARWARSAGVSGLTGPSSARGPIQSVQTVRWRVPASDHPPAVALGFPLDNLSPSPGWGILCCPGGLCHRFGWQGCWWRRATARAGRTRRLPTGPEPPYSSFGALILGAASGPLGRMQSTLGPPAGCRGLCFATRQTRRGRWGTHACRCEGITAPSA
jgi:hypothetical protein